MVTLLVGSSKKDNFDKSCPLSASSLTLYDLGSHEYGTTNGLGNKKIPLEKVAKKTPKKFI